MSDHDRLAYDITHSMLEKLTEEGVPDEDLEVVAPFARAVADAMAAVTLTPVLFVDCAFVLPRCVQGYAICGCARCTGG